MLGAYRPAGTRLLTAASQKIKGLAVVPQPSNNNLMWSSWPWATWIQPQIDAAIALGCNTVDMTGAVGQILAGSLTWAQVVAQYQQYLDYTANKGLMVIDGPTIAANWPTAYGYPAIEALFSQYHSFIQSRGYKHIIAFQIVNEINAQNVNLTAQQQAEIMATLVPYSRTLTNLPLTASFTVNTKAMLSDTSVQAVAPWCDYLDYHNYFDLQSSSPGEILPADYAALRSNSWWKGAFIIGESGQSVNVGTARQTATWDANRQIAQMNDCKGVIGFSVSDYENSQQWGVYQPASGTVFEPKTARSQCLTPFANFPAYP